MWSFEYGEFEKRLAGTCLEMQRNRRANEHSDRLATGGPNGSKWEKSITRVDCV